MALQSPKSRYRICPAPGEGSAAKKILFRLEPALLSTVGLFGQIPPREHLQILPQFHDGAARQDSSEIYSWIYDAIPPDDRTGIENSVAPDFGTIADDRAKLSQAGRDHSIGR